MAITPVVPAHLTMPLNDNNNSDNNLSSMMINTVTNSFQYEKQIQEKLTTLSQLSDTQSYTKLQTTLNDYTITMNLASTLARKSLNIVETLLKAQ
ncbi:type III secretion system inner rod subunit SctI [Proteus cibarius]|uniref:Type III secretion protein n=1 Tax=Proteus terrae subsp. cibarius TaxID=626774 RepID=A0A8I0WTL7_9GAMM|nr:MULTISPECIES: type III secretion system inner rod subunit SctI [Proteus]QHP77862.1 type III secretion protein [Proteus vulgaris]MBG2915650.1 type III secretion system inner rod subunit SctI [Proteus terrae subsp. cibarius]MBG3091697.1 type III secretion system inner rod subunit SctI [Proteus terrae subsp. cibarius]MBG6038648.1 type III secretion system inner rod subunit SctI [Proteus terrae subsp. cibarius]MCM2368168.1 type III secretion system inner rod subunit SctI [Proteus sp. FZP2095]